LVEYSELSSIWERERGFPLAALGYLGIWLGGERMEELHPSRTPFFFRRFPPFSNGCSNGFWNRFEGPSFFCPFLHRLATVSGPLVHLLYAGAGALLFAGFPSGPF